MSTKLFNNDCFSKRGLPESVILTIMLGIHFCHYFNDGIDNLETTSFGRNSNLALLKIYLFKTT